MEFFSQLTINSLIAAAIYALMALGFNLIFATTRFFNLAHGIYAAVGGYATLFFVKTLEMSLYVGILLGIVVAGGIGYLSNLVVYAPLKKRKASNMVLLVASLGVFALLQATIAMLFTSQFHTLSDALTSREGIEIGGGVITSVQLAMIFAAVLIMTALALVLKHTKFGKAVRAVSDDEEVAKIVGINTERITTRVFFVGGSIAGLAGILISFDTGIDPTIGMGLLLKGVIASIIGGVGNVYGSVLGALILGFAENFGIWNIAGEWKDAIAFGVLILFLIFRPKGILGK